MYINEGNPCVVNVCYQNEVCCVEIFINEVEELIFFIDMFYWTHTRKWFDLKRYFLQQNGTALINS